jgi:tetratricopeptide (TPR) repeat protein
MALGLVERYREEIDPERYYQASWDVVHPPYLNAFQYRFALQQAETACRLAPEQGKYLTTLGAAQYRAGDYKQALKTLTRAEQLHRATAAGLVLPLTPYLPALGLADELRQAMRANLAFLAMAQHRLGQKDAGQATLARLREVSKHPEEGKSPSDESMVRREAEALLGEKGAGPAN